MTRRGKIYGVVLDEKTSQLVDNYADENALSYSSVIRLALRRFFLEKEENNATKTV